MAPFCERPMIQIGPRIRPVIEMKAFCPAPRWRVLSGGGRIHPENCRLLWSLTSVLAGQLAGSKPRDEGRLGRLSDPTGRNVSEA